MAKNPVEDFLAEKRAFNFGGMARSAKPYGKRVAEGMGMGVATGIGAAAFAGATLAAHKLFQAATKTRDFNNMMDADPGLHELHQQDPAGFNRAFSALRTMAPEFMSEPTVAGAYMRKAFDSGEGAGPLAVQAATERSRSQGRPGPMAEAALNGFSRGAGLERKPIGSTKTTWSPGASGANGPVERVEYTEHKY